jgi:hypothetical protein
MSLNSLSIDEEKELIEFIEEYNNTLLEQGVTNPEEREQIIYLAVLLLKINYENNMF